MSPDDARLQDWLTGRLSTAEAANLRRDLADPALAESLVREAAELVALRAALRGQAGVDESGPRPSVAADRRRRPAAPRPPRRAPRRWKISRASLVGGATAVLLAVAVWLTQTDHLATAPDSEPDPATVAAPAWRVVAAGAGISQAGKRVGGGTLLSTGSHLTGPAGSHLRLMHRRTTIELELTGPFQIELVGDHDLRCQRGTLVAKVGRRQAGAPFQVDTPHAHCTVLGTRFRLQVTPMETELQVSEGRVAFQRRDLSGGLQPARIVDAGASAVSAVAAAAPVPLIAYPLRDGAGALAGSGRLSQILSLQLERPPQWTGTGLLLDADHHCVTATNAPWPDFRAAVVASRALSLSVRVRNHGAAIPEQLLATLYIRMSDPRQRRLITVRTTEPVSEDWVRWTVTVTPDGRMRSYRGSELLRDDELAHWPPAPEDQSIQLKLLEPLGHHGEATSGLAIEFGDVLLFDRALGPDDLRYIDN